MGDLDADTGRQVTIASAAGGPGEHVITLSGELDILGAESLREAIDGALAAGAERLTFDVEALRFIDSAGLAALIEATTKARDVRLRSPSAPVRRTIELTGLAAVLPVEP
jgi:anti-sigma B factor antagonist